jgi:patatin-like phospholipase/acyl hydrolase
MDPYRVYCEAFFIFYILQVAIVSTLVNQPVLKPHVFCNYTHPYDSSPRFSSGCQHKIWEALKASSAAPGFFEECKLGTDIHQVSSYNYNFNFSLPD